MTRVISPDDPAFPAWCAEQDAKADSYVAQRRAYLEGIGWPWPKRVRKAKKPHPGLVDYADEEEG